jgi:hypothetical protein
MQDNRTILANGIKQHRVPEAGQRFPQDAYRFRLKATKMGR